MLILRTNKNVMCGYELNNCLTDVMESIVNVEEGIDL